ncbi:MAG: hypothetical protein ABI162_05470 [Luteolibacter sp.]
MLEKNPASALRFLARISPAELQADLQARLLHDWAERAPREALEAALGMDNGPSTRLLGIVYETWADHDMAAAMASLDGLPSEFSGNARAWPSQVSRSASTRIRPCSLS